MEVSGSEKDVLTYCFYVLYFTVVYFEVPNGKQGLLEGKQWSSICTLSSLPW